MYTMRNAKTSSRTNKNTYHQQAVYKDTVIYIYIQAQIKGLCNLTLQNVGYQ